MFGYNRIIDVKFIKKDAVKTGLIYSLHAYTRHINYII